MASRIAGPTFPGYLKAVRMRGRTVAYAPRESWTSRYERMLAEGELTDATTIKRDADPRRVRYHYNAVENAILEQLFRCPVVESPTVLDVGAGAGHWIDFYREVLGAREVVGIEIAASAANVLAAAYGDVPNVTVVEADVSEPGFELGRRFDLVNAVDVLFHIVDDSAWRRAVGNLARHLAPGGRLIVAEYVSLVTHDLGFRPPSASSSAALVTKRARSLRDWRSCARGGGLSLLGSARIRKSRALLTPANRVLVLG